MLAEHFPLAHPNAATCRRQGALRSRVPSPDGPTRQAVATSAPARPPRSAGTRPGVVLARRRLPTVCLVALTVAGAATAILLAACAQLNTVSGSGELRTVTFDLADFDRVHVGFRTAYVAEIVQGDTFHVAVTATNDVGPHLRLLQNGDTLTLTVRSTTVIEGAPPQVSIVMPALRELIVGSGSQVRLSGFDVPGRFDLQAEEASSVSGDLLAAEVRFELSGDSSVEVRGSARLAVINGSGASRFILDDFLIDVAGVELRDASTATLTVASELGPVRLSGASSLIFGGGATVTDVSRSEGSVIERRER